MHASMTLFFHAAEELCTPLPAGDTTRTRLRFLARPQLDFVHFGGENQA